jgi:hypothetical protein
MVTDPAGLFKGEFQKVMGSAPLPMPKIDRKPRAWPSCDAGTASVMAEESTDEWPMIAKP